MGAFAGEFEWLRWVVVAAFVVTAGIVLAGLAATPLGATPSGATPSGATPSGVGRVADGYPADAVSGAGHGVVHGVPWSRDHASDAAHLLMCLVMSAMLVFPVAASDATRTVLTAMVAVFALMLVGRLPEGRARGPGAATVFGYHLVAAGAMLYAMSGHHHGHHGPVAPLLVLAVLFLADAGLMVVPGTRRLVRHVIPHPAGPLAAVPHLMMDLGTAYMLLTAAAG
ncbi:DUF5134 domain-containing protein [Nocardia aurantia]|uniref:DUF5134 domain-containing protein n=1 Tax=Nocardia aurantia TaxID=2585199 RepID=A0A7K0DHX8_9NOCA|nr:DUF5134 domain-containing protein [Nocardia aurantia]MQY25257.1 hypothetical protein [Nocardia aurantia]